MPWVVIKSVGGALVQCLYDVYNVLSRTRANAIRVLRKLFLTQKGHPFYALGSHP